MPHPQRSRLNYTRHIRRLRVVSLRGLAIERHYDKPPLFAPQSDLELHAINVFSGPNGSGKTTILDAVRSLFEPAMLAKLRRENISADVASGLRVVFDSGSEVIALFHQIGQPQDDVRKSEWEWQRTELRLKLIDAYGAVYAGSVNAHLPVEGTVDETLLEPFRSLLSKLGRVGRCWPSASLPAPSVAEYVSVLNRFRRYFPHNQSKEESGPKTHMKPGELRIGDGRLRQYHGDDLRQASRLSLEYLPSGWQQVVDLLSWVERCDDNSICVIDEPERHLHPTLQRAVAAELALIRRRKNLQFVIATHSPTFLHRRAWGDDDVALFHMSGGRAVPEPKLHRVLDQLGCLASDLCQSNGVIWVEGPSDRVYIKAFLRAWRTVNKPDRPLPVENLDYTFSLFDGSCLSHYAGDSAFDLSSDEDPAELIGLLSLNRNLAICMDRDNDFGVDDFGSVIPINAMGRTKSRVAAELGESGNAVIHLTDHYTLECYVAEAMHKGFLGASNGRVQVSGNKVQQANRFSRLPEVRIYECLERHSGLMRFVAQLDAAVERWMSPGEY